MPGARRGLDDRSCVATTALTLDRRRADRRLAHAEPRRRACTPRSPRRSAAGGRRRCGRRRGRARGRRGSRRSASCVTIAMRLAVLAARGRRAAAAPRGPSARVEVAGRLVGEDEVGRGGERAGDRDALLLSAAESWCGRCRSRAPSPRVSTSPSMRARSSALGRRPSRSNGSRMLPIASRVGTRLKAWKTKPTRRRRRIVRSRSRRAR